MLNAGRGTDGRARRRPPPPPIDIRTLQSEHVRHVARTQKATAKRIGFSCDVLDGGGGVS